eukprot:CAMPEP_0182420584 /NCGR_PEP_ID=MMETSP1167-20130531/5500_1 /TAXON_ID=2988 /ORGANISM="Mallomonas Sp, Strain CCMP3275" /LENGTH=381 /DNA_ID=CAMNT_0024596739 /DNA_START=345 /DNA_END=1487 /DNA_ORIENTATION=+
MLEKEDFSRGMSVGEVATVRCAALMDEVWVPTPWMKDVFTALLHQMGVRHTSIIVIPEAVDTTLFHPEKANRTRFRLVSSPDPSPVSDLSSCSSLETYTASTYDINNCVGAAADINSFQFLSVFKWEYRKGWDILLTAYWSTFHRSDPVVLRLHTHVPSSDKDTRNLTHRIDMFARERFGRSMDELARVVWETDRQRERESQSGGSEMKKEQFLTRADMRDLLASADAFVLPTRGEGWGLPISEAMSMQLPVIVSNCTGPAYFTNDSTAYVLPVVSGTDELGYCRPDITALSRILKQVIVDAKTELAVEDSNDSSVTTNESSASNHESIRSDNHKNLKGELMTKTARLGRQARRAMEEISPHSVVKIMESRIRELAGNRGW